MQNVGVKRMEEILDEPKPQCSIHEFVISDSLPWCQIPVYDGMWFMLVKIVHAPA